MSTDIKYLYLCVTLFEQKREFISDTTMKERLV